MGTYYHKYIAEGRCGRCGKINDRPDKKICSECAKNDTKNKAEDRKWYRDLGYCPLCGKNKLMGQEKTCVECRAKNAEHQAKRRESNRDGYNAYMREYKKTHYDKRKELGVCPRCGRQRKDRNCKLCNFCRNDANNRNRHKTKKEYRTAHGLCVWCDAPIKPGYKVCEKHYQMNCEKAKKANRDYLRKSNKALFIKY